MPYKARFAALRKLPEVFAAIIGGGNSAGRILSIGRAGRSKCTGRSPEKKRPGKEKAPESRSCPGLFEWWA